MRKRLAQDVTAVQVQDYGAHVDPQPRFAARRWTKVCFGLPPAHTCTECLASGAMRQQLCKAGLFGLLTTRLERHAKARLALSAFEHVHLWMLLQVRRREPG